MEHKKREIIRTATRLFSVKGYNNTSVDEIAKESGIAKASFYKLFASKEDVLIGSLILFKEDIERRIKQLRGLSGLTPKQKLVRYIEAYLESTFEYKVYMLLFMSHDFVCSQNEMLIASGINIDNNLNTWIKDGLMDVYGHGIESYVWDVTFLMRGIAIEYLRVHQPDEETEVLPRLAEYIGGVVDLVVSGLAQKNDYTPFWTVPPWFCPPNEPNPFMTGMKVKRAVRDMEQIVRSLDRTERLKTECLQVLEQLLRTFQEDEPATGLLKACLAFLEQVPELRAGCGELRELLGLSHVNQRRNGL